MKLLFDENLSPKLVRRLADHFPESVHVRDAGLKAADDPPVWEDDFASFLSLSWGARSKY